MARRRKKKLSRNGRIFVLICTLALLTTIGLSLIFANIGGKFNTNTFVIVFIILIIVFSAIVIVFSIPAVKEIVGKKRRLCF